MTPLQSIASMPLKDLSLAYQALTGDTSPQPRSVMQSAILAGINRGKWTLSMVQAGATGWPQQARPAAAPAPAPAPVRHTPQAAAPAELAATRAAADRAEDAARQALAQANRAESMAKDAATAATTVNFLLQLRLRPSSPGRQLHLIQWRTVLLVRSHRSVF